MKSPDTWTKTRGSAIVPLVALALVLPAITGGCPEYRNGVVDAFDAASRTVLFGEAGVEDAIVDVLVGIADATLDLAFDSLRVVERR